jgi:hypothetical protein
MAAGFSTSVTCGRIYARSAFEAGFLGRQMPDLSGLYDLSFLNQVLTEKKKRAVQ